MTTDLFVEGAKAWRRVVEERPAEEALTETIESRLLFALKCLEVVRVLWKRRKEELYQGVEVRRAREKAAAASVALREWQDLVQAACNAGEQAARRAGARVEGLDEAKQALSELKAMLAEADDMLVVLARPRATSSGEPLHEARQAFERGEGEDAEAILARRKATRPS